MDLVTMPIAEADVCVATATATPAPQLEQNQIKKFFGDIFGFSDVPSAEKFAGPEPCEREHRLEAVFRFVGEHVSGGYSASTGQDASGWKYHIYWIDYHNMIDIGL